MAAASTVQLPAVPVAVIALESSSTSLLDASMPKSSSNNSTAREMSVASRLAHARQQRSLERAQGVKQTWGGGGEKCEVCGKTAYYAERKVVGKRIFHTACFCCATCKKPLGNDYGFCANEEGVDTPWVLTRAPCRTASASHRRASPAAWPWAWALTRFAPRFPRRRYCIAHERVRRLQNGTAGHV